MKQRQRDNAEDALCATVAEGYHVPVMLKESVDGLNIHRDGVYVDATFGGGGHSREILSRLNGSGRLYGFDQDADAEANLHDVGENFTFVRSNFRYLSNWMRYYDEEAIDGIIADLGMSSHHVDDAERGFSFRFDAPLDMRMNRRDGMTAADLLNTAEEETLAEIFRSYGELRDARRLAAAISKARKEKTIATTGNLADIAKTVFRREHEKKDMAKLFQALRMEVNHETEALEELLLSATTLLRKGGRMVVITYHSIEDRIVKNVMKSGNIEGKVVRDFYGQASVPFQLVNNKVITANEQELETNPRSRSAKLRIAEKR